MRWTLIVEESGRPGSINMGVDCSLLRLAQEGAAFLRLYAWNPSCLSFGRNEPAQRRYDRDEIERLGLDTVRRPTGGRAVWHSTEVTYAVAAPAATFGSLRETYNIIHAMIAKALQRLGADAAVAPSGAHERGSLEDGACFAAPVGGEVVVRGRKLVGSAQLREGRAFLQHGSILLEDRQDVVARVTRGDVVAPAATSLGALLGRVVAFSEVANAISTRAAASWPGSWEAAPSPPVTDACRLFDDPGWTWRR